jgi:hypothetical protein
VYLVSGTLSNNAITEILELAHHLRLHFDNMSTNSSITTTDSNGSFIRLAGLTIQAMTWLQGWPRDDEERTRRFQFLDTIERTAGAYFANIARHPEEMEGFRIVDALVIAIVNEMIHGTNLYQEYHHWRGERIHLAQAEQEYRRREEKRMARMQVPKVFKGG